jgi:hypothetical protein
MRDRSATIATADVLEKTEQRAVYGAIIGTIFGLVDDVLLVTFPGQEGSDPVVCRTTVDVTPDLVGQPALLICEHGDVRRPILIGCVRDTIQLRSWPTATLEIEADQKRVTVTAKEQIVLQCGTASITLTKAGKVIMRGEYISQRSTGVVRIKGGCVEIN